ncbi:MAG: adenylate/guanylate cyclase domain-containing protein [Pseudomonadota bacterium]
MVARPDSATPFGARVERSIAREAQRGLIVAAKTRIGLTAGILLWALFDQSATGASYWYQTFAIGIFIPLGFLHWWAARTGAPRFRLVYALFAFDLVLAGVINIAPNPFVDPVPTPHLMFNVVEYYWLFIFVLQAAFAASARLILWTGAWLVVVRAGQIAFVLVQPDTFTEAALAPGDAAGFQLAYYQPGFVYMFQRVGDLIFAVCITIIAAALVSRSRSLVHSEALSERSRAQLARYVPAPVVDEIASGGGPFRAPENKLVAVMFVDIVGFTAFTESHPPDDTMALLRDYHGRAADAVFARNGAIDKFIGDGIMATFGFSDDPTPPPDAAFLAAIDIIAAIEAMNRDPANARFGEVRVGIGLDFGQAVIGNVGTLERLELAVIGDVVNTASRTEAMTRALNADLAATGRFMNALRPDTVARLPLEEIPGVLLRGKTEAVSLWVYRQG